MPPKKKAKVKAAASAAAPAAKKPRVRKPKVKEKTDWRREEAYKFITSNFGGGVPGYTGKVDSETLLRPSIYWGGGRKSIMRIGWLAVKAFNNTRNLPPPPDFPERPPAPPRKEKEAADTAGETPAEEEEEDE